MDASPAEPDEFLEYRIIRTAEHLRRRFAEALRPHGLSAHQFSVLAVLDARPGVTSAELARAVLMTPQGMAALVDQLETDGLIEPRAQRGRGVRAPTSLSPAGVALLQTAAATVRVLDQETRAAVGERGAAELLAGLDRVDRYLSTSEDGAR